MSLAKNSKRVGRKRRAAAGELRQMPKIAATAEYRAQRRKIADAVKLHIEDNQISRPQFEKMVKRSESTMNHFFSGDFSDALLLRVEHALGKNFSQSSSVAPSEWGGYTQEATKQFTGTFLTLRNDFGNPVDICAYVTSIEWGPIQHAHMFDGRLIQKPAVDGYGLIFREERRIDVKYTHRGQVWIPFGQYLYLVSAYGDGRLRAAIVSVPDIDGKMAGIQLSQYNPIGSAFTPAAAPVVLLRREKISKEEVGKIEPTHPLYEVYRQFLLEALEAVKIALPVAN